MNAKYRKSKPKSYKLEKSVHVGYYTVNADIVSQRIYLADEANAFMNQQEKELMKLRSNLYEEKGFVTTENFIEMQKRAEKVEAEVRYLKSIQQFPHTS